MASEIYEEGVGTSFMMEELQGSSGVNDGLLRTSRGEYGVGLSG